ncbi:hypothetical protein [Ornithinimicrobium flavum]|uniref:hypothetical protein n=1 Tax=Ornithinimicrobium flavum TaxID=1288636 RepID=UPI00106F24CB|nr:hypothetical protein [Ornithinimicrobium flavum]
MSRMKDWVEDESLTREETLARFEALSPEPVTGPRDLRAVTAAMIEEGWTLVRVEGNEVQPGVALRNVSTMVRQ